METTTKKEFDAVEYMRQQRNVMSEKLSKMSKAEVVAYFKGKGSEVKIQPSA